MHIKNEKLNIELRTISFNDLKELWNISYKDNLEWMNYDGPYFNDPIYDEDKFIFEIGSKYYISNDLKLAIIKDNKIIGTVSAYFEDGELRKWLEIEIDIYN